MERRMDAWGVGEQAASKQASSKLAPPGPKPKENETPCWGFVALRILGPQTIIPGPRNARFPPAVGLCAPEPGAGSKWTQNGPKSPKTGPGGPETGAGGVHCPYSWAESTRVMCGLPLCRVLTAFCPEMVSVRPIWAWAQKGPKSPKTGPGTSETGARGIHCPRQRYNPLGQC